MRSVNLLGWTLTFDASSSLAATQALHGSPGSPRVCGFARHPVANRRFTPNRGGMPGSLIKVAMLSWPALRDGIVFDIGHHKAPVRLMFRPPVRVFGDDEAGSTMIALHRHQSRLSADSWNDPVAGVSLWLAVGHDDGKE